jgi:hypothetical protein
VCRTGQGYPKKIRENKEKDTQNFYIHSLYGNFYIYSLYGNYDTRYKITSIPQLRINGKKKPEREKEPEEQKGVKNK